MKNGGIEKTRMRTCLIVVALLLCVTAKTLASPPIREKYVATWKKCDPRANIGQAKPADDPFLIPFYTGNIQPTPQQVSYGEQYFPLAKTGILLGEGLRADDARVAVLTERIRRYGGKPEFVDNTVGDYDTFISLGKTDLAGSLQDMKEVPSKPQGYVIHCTQHQGQNIVAMQGSDHQGLLWAITSFNQLVHHRDGKIVTRTAEVFDYPIGLKRGNISSGNWYPHGPVAGAWFYVRFKMNMIAFIDICNYPGQYPEWRRPESEAMKEDIRQVGQYLTPLGIEWYTGERTLNNPCPPKEQLCCGSDEDFQTALKTAELAAEVGGGFALLFDDLRFPLHPKDKERFGSAREADIYFVNRLYTALQKKHPGTNLLFCPPFYWGPTAKHPYPESRDEYLTAIGKRLPKEIKIHWTGPRVRSNEITPQQVEWMAERIGRKPTIWQNRFGLSHLNGLPYTTDPVTAWADWYYDGFLQNIEGYMLNGSEAMRATTLITLSDYLWNPKAYDAKASIREAVRKVVGPDSFSDLDEINRMLSYFDQFGRRISPNAVKRSAEILTKLDELEQAIDKAKAKYPATLDVWTGTIHHHAVSIRRWVRSLVENPDLSGYVQNAEITKKQAMQEANFSSQTDTLLPAYDFLGGVSAQPYSHQGEKRLATWIHGSKSAYPKMGAEFTIAPFPPSGDYQLILSAQDDESESKCRIKITINGKTIFSGPNPFVKGGWSRHTFRIPARVLSPGNQLVIHSEENTIHSDGPPWFMLNYAVIRKTK